MERPNSQTKVPSEVQALRTAEHKMWREKGADRAVRKARPATQDFWLH